MKKLMIFLLVLVFVLLPLTVKADVRVNGDTGESVFLTNIATNINNQVVIAWSLETATNHNLMVQRYDSLGNRVGLNIVAKSLTNDTIIYPTSAIMNSQGDFIVAWSDLKPPYLYTPSDIFLKILHFDGTPINTIQVSDTPASYQDYPKLAMDTAGNFVCAWTKRTFDYWEENTVQAQLFDSQYQKVGSIFVVDDSVIPSYVAPGMNKQGHFAIAYDDYLTDYVFVRIFNEIGEPETLFQVNQTALAVWPDLAMNSKGRYVVAWRDGIYVDIWAQIFDENNQRIGSEFMVSQINNVIRNRPEVAMNEKGDFVVVWADRIGSDSIIYSQRYLADGTKIGEKYRVNDSTQASISAFQNRNFDVAATNEMIYYTWVGNNETDVYAKRVDWCYPTKRGDANCNGDRTVTDVVYLINYLFKNGVSPCPFLEAGDANGDGETNIVDVVYLIRYLFKGGLPPYQVPDFQAP